MAVILQRKVFTPDSRVVRFVRQLDNAKEWILRFLLALHDICEQGKAENRSGKRSKSNEQYQFESVRSWFCIFLDYDIFVLLSFVFFTHGLPPQCMCPTSR